MPMPKLRPVLTVSTDDFSPPLTIGQARQVQDFVNRGLQIIGARLNPDEPAPDLDPEQHFGNEPDFYEQMDRARSDVAAFLGVPVEAIQITVNHDVTEEPEFHCEICESATHDAIAHRTEPVLIETGDVGPYFGERVTDAEQAKRADDDWEIRAEWPPAHQPEPGAFETVTESLRADTFPAATVSRGGITFGGVPVTKKSLRKQLAREQKLRWRAERKVARLLKVIRKMA